MSNEETDVTQTSESAAPAPAREAAPKTANAHSEGRQGGEAAGSPQDTPAAPPPASVEASPMTAKAYAEGRPDDVASAPSSEDARHSLQEQYPRADEVIAELD